MRQQAGMDRPVGSSHFDEAGFRDHIRAEWDSVADDWGREGWERRVEEAAGRVSRKLLEMARVSPGDRVLDLGTGVGEPAGQAARRVGETGRVVGLDLSPRMVAAGTRRMERLGLADVVELKEGDAGDPDVEPASFDAALSRWVLMLVPDLAAALGRVRRTLKPGGRLAVGLWGHPSRVPMISLALSVAQEMLQMPAPPPGTPTHLWTGGHQRFTSLLEAAGFREIEHRSVATVFEFRSTDDYADFIITMAGPLRMAIEAMPPEGRRALRAGLSGAMAELAGGGPFTLVNETLCVAGRRPEG